MKLLVLPGDGIGPEITAATLAVLDSASRKFALRLEYDRREIGLAALQKEGTTLPAGVLERAREVDGVILGPLDQLRYPPAEQGGLTADADRRRRNQPAVELGEQPDHTMPRGSSGNLAPRRRQRLLDA